MGIKIHNYTIDMDCFLKDYNFLKLCLTHSKYAVKKCTAMKFSIQKKCILPLFFAASSLFGGVQANQQPVHWNISILHTAYVNFLSVSHDPSIAAYSAALVRVLEAIDALKHTTIFQDIQQVPHTCKLDNLGRRFGYPFQNINDLQRLLNRLETCCTHMLMNGLSNPMPNVQIKDNINSLFRINRYNRDTNIVSRYAELARGLNLNPGSLQVYNAIEDLGRAIGIILAKPHTFPSTFGCPNDFYELLHMVQILCIYSITGLTKIYAQGHDTNAFTGRFAPMFFESPTNLWFHPQYVQPSAGFQLISFNVNKH